MVFVSVHLPNNSPFRVPGPPGNCLRLNICALQHSCVKLLHTYRYYSGTYGAWLGHEGEVQLKVISAPPTEQRLLNYSLLPEEGNKDGICDEQALTRHQIFFTLVLNFSISRSKFLQKHYPDLGNFIQRQVETKACAIIQESLMRKAVECCSWLRTIL